MLRLIALTALVLAANPALALTDAELITRQYEAQHWCKIPEDAPDQAASDKACEDKVALADKLEKLGYCLVLSEQEWHKCQ